jgi:hypothetical protein
MAEVKTFQCDGCSRYQLHLPGGLHWVKVTRVVEGGRIPPVEKRVQFCNRCLDRADQFTFNRGFETSKERAARKEAEAKRKETSEDAGTGA